MKIVSIMWSSYVNMLVRASRNTADILELSAHSSKTLEQDPEKLDAALQEAATDLKRNTFCHFGSMAISQSIKQKLMSC